MPSPSPNPLSGAGGSQTYRSAADAPRVLEHFDQGMAVRGQTIADLTTADLSTYANLLLAAGRWDAAEEAMVLLSARQTADRDLLQTLTLLAGARGDREAQTQRLAAWEQSFPGDPDAANLRASLLLEQGNLKGAQSAWRTVLTRREDPEALVGLATLSLADDQPQDALKLADRAVKAAAGDDQTWAIRARALTALERYSEAKQDLDRAIGLAPDDSWHRLDRGRLSALHLYRPEEAKADLELVVNQDPDNLLAWVSLAAVYEELALRNQAYQAWTRALALRPDYRPAFPSAAMLAFQYRDFDRAAAYAKEAAKDHPGEYAFPLVEGLALKALGRTKESQFALEKARPRFTRGSTVDEMFRFLLTPGMDQPLQNALNLEKKELVKIRLRFYQGVAYALSRSANAARAAFQEVADSALPGIPEVASARDWLTYGF